MKIELILAKLAKIEQKLKKEQEMKYFKTILNKGIFIGILIGFVIGSVAMSLYLSFI